MKKFLLIPALLLLLFIMGCEGNGNPKKIEGLIVPSCDELAASMEITNPNSTNNELYKAASDILFSDNRPEEAKLCCANIIDQKVRGKCEKREGK